MLCLPNRVTLSLRTGFVLGVVEGVILRTASPLTPALSPLRGEGVARGVSGHLTTSPRGGIALNFARGSKRTSRQFASPINGSSTVRFDSGGPMPSTRYLRAVAYSNLKEASNASPSPLKGERAGVRGEAVRRLVPSETAQTRSMSPSKYNSSGCS